MTQVLDVVALRVFTDADGGHGNKLGIIESSLASAGREQEIAAALGFSETVFVDRIELAPEASRAAHIRIFTPVAELPFAGHPSVGTAWWLAQQGVPAAVLREKAGDVRVHLQADMTWVAARGAWAPDYEWIPLPTAAEVDALDPAVFRDGHHYAYAWIDRAAGRVRSRMFAPAAGIKEDEATGAAAVRLTSWLRRGLRITQGAGSEIFTAPIAADRVRLGGRTIFDHRMAITL